MHAFAFLAILLCVLIPSASPAQVVDVPGDELAAPESRIERKRRPRVAIGPVKSKRPGGIGEEAFKEHIDAIEDYFIPLAGNIVSASGDVLTSDLSIESGVIPGMRLRVMRAAAAFTHPVTGEKVTGAETAVGMAEVVEEIEGRGARLRLTEGEAVKGDVVRISSAPAQVYFYQGADVDWDVSEEYYFWLEGSDRFRILDAPPGAIEEEELIRAASEAGASVVLTVSSEGMPEGKGPGMALRQRALWVADGREFFTSLILVDDKMLEAFKIAGEMFWPKKDKPVLEIKTPLRAVLMEAADLDCDGEDEVVLSTGTSLSVFAMDIKLRPPFGLEMPLEIRGDMRREHVWLDASDIDRDGCDELLLTTVKDDHEVRSFVYDYSGGEVKTVWKGDLFARIIDGSLHVQDFDDTGGYAGVIRRLGPASEGWPEEAGAGLLELPAGVNIHDFSFISSVSGQRHLLAQDRMGNLVLYNGISDEVLWRSEDSYGGALRRFNRRSPASLPEDDKETWHVSDRMLGMDSEVFAIYKEPVSGSAPGLGFTGSGIIRITDPGAETREEVMIRDIPRAAVSIAVSGQRLLVLRDTYSVNLLNIFRGRKMFVSKIMLYSLEGI
jgi:hypothetical protein